MPLTKSVQITPPNNFRPTSTLPQKLDSHCFSIAQKVPRPHIEIQTQVASESLIDFEARMKAMFEEKCREEEQLLHDLQHQVENFKEECKRDSLETRVTALEDGMHALNLRICEIKLIFKEIDEAQKRTIKTVIHVAAITFSAGAVLTGIAVIPAHPFLGTLLLGGIQPMTYAIKSGFPENTEFQGKEFCKRWITSTAMNALSAGVSTGLPLVHEYGKHFLARIIAQGVISVIGTLIERGLVNDQDLHFGHLVSAFAAGFGGATTSTALDAFFEGLAIPCVVKVAQIAAEQFGHANPVKAVSNIYIEDVLKVITAGIDGATSTFVTRVIRAFVDWAIFRVDDDDIEGVKEAMWVSALTSMAIKASILYEHRKLMREYDTKNEAIESLKILENEIKTIENEIDRLLTILSQIDKDNAAYVAELRKWFDEVWNRGYRPSTKGHHLDKETVFNIILTSKLGKLFHNGRYVYVAVNDDKLHVTKGNFVGNKSESETHPFTHPFQDPTPTIADLNNKRDLLLKANNSKQIFLNQNPNISVNDTPVLPIEQPMHYPHILHVRSLPRAVVQPPAIALPPPSNPKPPSSPRQPSPEKPRIPPSIPYTPPSDSILLSQHPLSPRKPSPDQALKLPPKTKMNKPLPLKLDPHWLANAEKHRDDLVVKRDGNATGSRRRDIRASLNRQIRAIDESIAILKKKCM